MSTDTRPSSSSQNRTNKACANIANTFRQSASDTVCQIGARACFTFHLPSAKAHFVSSWQHLMMWNESTVLYIENGSACFCFTVMDAVNEKRDPFLHRDLKYVLRQGKDAARSHMFSTTKLSEMKYSGWRRQTHTWKTEKENSAWINLKHRTIKMHGYIHHCCPNPAAHAHSSQGT